MRLKLTASPSALPELIETALTLVVLVMIGLFLDGFFVGQVSHTIAAGMGHGGLAAAV